MKYNGMIYRPPVEADTFLIPVTEGCTHNSCSFCNMYQGVPFRMLSLSETDVIHRLPGLSFRDWVLPGGYRASVCAREESMPESILLTRDDILNLSVKT